MMKKSSAAGWLAHTEKLLGADAEGEPRPHICGNPWGSSNYWK
jgi:hypothetical protein